ncbi:hypothetical protein N9O57_00385 [bacterium]|nr:hypothetical protein [bacterium]
MKKTFILSLLVLNVCFGEIYHLNGNKLLKARGTMLETFDLSSGEAKYKSNLNFKKYVQSFDYDKESKLGLVLTEMEGKYTIFAVNLESNTIAFDTEEYKDVVKAFWLGKCRFAILQDNKDHGGTLVYVPLPERITKKLGLTCVDVKPSVKDVPKDEKPRCLWQSDPLNLWAYYSNGARKIFSDLGDGDFFGIDHDEERIVFKESVKPDRIFFKSAQGKKSQFLASGKDYKSMGEKGVLVLNNKDELVFYSGKDLKIQKTLAKSVSKFYVDESGSKAFVEFKDNKESFIDIR